MDNYINTLAATLGTHPFFVASGILFYIIIGFCCACNIGYPKIIREVPIILFLAWLIVLILAPVCLLVILICILFIPARCLEPKKPVKAEVKMANADKCQYCATELKSKERCINCGWRSEPELSKPATTPTII